MKLDRRPPSRLANYLDVLPAHAIVPTGAKRLHGRFFGCESRGIPLEAIGFCIAVADFAFGKDPADESLAKAIDRLSNWRDSGNIDPRAKNHEFRLAQGYRSRSPR